MPKDGCQRRLPIKLLFYLISGDEVDRNIVVSFPPFFMRTIQGDNLRLSRNSRQ